MDVFSNTRSRDGHESPVTFKGSLLVLSQLTSCGLTGDGSSFCSPQQLTRAISGHKGYCQHLTHCLSSWTRPRTKEPWGTRAGLGAAWRWPPKAANGSARRQRGCDAEPRNPPQPDIPRVSHYPAVYHHQLATTGVQSDLPHPAILPHTSRNGCWSDSLYQIQSLRGEMTGEWQMETRESVWWYRSTSTISGIQIKQRESRAMCTASENLWSNTGISAVVSDHINLKKLQKWGNMIIWVDI